MRLIHGINIIILFIEFVSCNESYKKMEQFVENENVAFKCENDNIKGVLCAQIDGHKKPAVVILGPICSVKEQSPIHYATKLAEKGFVALCFDARGYGESDGEPRQFESLKKKEQDVKAAIDYLIDRKDVDTSKIFLLGICNGANEMMQVSIVDSRVKSLVLISGNYLIKENMVQLLGSETVFNNHLRRAKFAKAKFETTGEIQYIDIVSKAGTEQLLPPMAIYDWYHPWENKAPYFGYRGGWQNKVAAMSEWETLNFNALEVAKKVTKPTLVIHGELSDGGYLFAKKIFSSISTSNKKSIWIDKTVHFQFYDDPLIIGRSINEIANWLNTNDVQ